MSNYLISLLLVFISGLTWAASVLPVTIQTADRLITASPDKLPIRLNEIHSWTVSIKDKSGLPVKGLKFQVKGGMPEHRHGLPTQPHLIDEPSPGEYLIDGLKFNMAGTWQIELISSTSQPSFHYLIEFEIDHANAR